MIIRKGRSFGADRVFQTLPTHDAFIMLGMKAVFIKTTYNTAIRINDNGSISETLFLPTDVVYPVKILKIETE
jgi:hypothetical protein